MALTYDIRVAVAKPCVEGPAAPFADREQVLDRLEASNLELVRVAFHHLPIDGGEEVLWRAEDGPGKGQS